MTGEIADIPPGHIRLDTAQKKEVAVEALQAVAKHYETVEPKRRVSAAALALVGIGEAIKKIDIRCIPLPHDPTIDARTKFVPGDILWDTLIFLRNNGASDDSKETAGEILADIEEARGQDPFRDNFSSSRAT